MMNASIDFEKDVARLLLADSPVARIDLYLRIFYSPKAAEAALAACRDPSRAAPSTVEWLRTIDFERLLVERQLRLAQLAGYLKRHCGALWSMFTRSEALDLATSFADSPQFWIARGRSLAENFALYIEEKFRLEGRQFQADLVRLLGTISGIALWPDKASPWPAHASVAVPLRAGAIAAEGFLSSFELLDDEGSIRSPQSEALEPPRPQGFQVTVWAYRDRSTLVGCARLDH